MCLDMEEELSIRGGQFGKLRQQLVVDVEVCNGADCKTPAEIEKWLENKYLVLFNN